MSEDGQLLQMRMNRAQPFLVGRQVAPPAGVEEECPAKVFATTIPIIRMDRGGLCIRGAFGHSPSFPHLCPGTRGMLEQQMVKGRPLDLKRRRLPRESPVPKIQKQRLASIPEMKLSAVFFNESSRFQLRQHSHRLKNLVVVRQQRFTNMKAGEMFLLQEQHPLSPSREKRRDGAPRRPPANHNRIIIQLAHWGHYRGKHPLKQASRGKASS